MLYWEMHEKKPEHMTSLNGEALVSKTHERIAFRGLVDSLEADLIEAQVLATVWKRISLKPRYWPCRCPIKICVILLGKSLII